MSIVFDPSKTALLVMDYQNAIVSMVPEGIPQVLEKVSAALSAARAAKLKVFHVVVGFREGFPEVSPRNKSFKGLRESGRFIPGSSGAEIHASVAAQAGDLLVTKHRVSAFSGSDLDMLLRAGGIETLVLAGISTSGVVLSTLRQAADLDFALAVLEDACLDPDPSVHSCLITKVFPRQAEILTVDAFLAALAI